MEILRTPKEIKEWSTVFPTMTEMKTPTITMSIAQKRGIWNENDDLECQQKADEAPCHLGEQGDNGAGKEVAMGGGTELT
ncbi:hypothetical protein LT330_001391 [Penicillium expansum]|nr:hypothetical protein LT330_001391 [Penicillium expansum]